MRPSGRGGEGLRQAPGDAGLAPVIYEVTEGGETLRIELAEVGEGVYDLSFDGGTVRVDAAKSGRTIYSIIENGSQFEAMVEERGAHGFDILVSGRLFHLEAVDERSKFYLLRRGTVDVLMTGADGTEKKLDEMGPGGSFGEVALLMNQPRNATVRAATRAEVYAVDRTTFDRFRAESRPFIDRILTNFLRRPPDAAPADRRA